MEAVCDATLARDPCEVAEGAQVPVAAVGKSNLGVYGALDETAAEAATEEKAAEALRDVSVPDADVLAPSEAPDRAADTEKKNLKNESKFDSADVA